MKQLREIHVPILKNPYNNLEKSTYQFWPIHLTTLKIHQSEQISTRGLTRQGNAKIGLGTDKNGNQTSANWNDDFGTGWLWKNSRKGSDVDPSRHPVCRQFEKCIHSWGGVVRVNLRIHIYAANCAHSVSRGYADASIAWSIINAYCHLQLTELVVNTRSELWKFRGYDTSYLLTISLGNQ